MIRFVFIIQVYFLLKYGERVSYEEVSYVLSQKLVNPCKQDVFNVHQADMLVLVVEGSGALLEVRSSVLTGYRTMRTHLKVI